MTYKVKKKNITQTSLCLPSSWSWPEPSSSSPPPLTHWDWGWSPQWWSLPHMEKWQKLFLWWALPHTSLLCLFGLLLEFNSLPQTLQANTLPLCCQILCLLSICKDLKALSQTLQGWTLFLSLMLGPANKIPSSNILSLTNLPSTPAGPVASRWAVSTHIHLLPKTDPHLKDDVADDKADPLVFLQLNQISVLQYFFKGLAPRTTKMCLDRLFFLKKFLPQWWHCSGKQGRVASGRQSGASGGPKNSWFWVSTMWLFNFILVKKNLEAGAAGEGDKWQKGQKEISPTCHPPPPGCPPLYLTSSSPPSSTYHHHPPSSPPHPPPAPPL